MRDFMDKKWLVMGAVALLAILASLYWLAFGFGPEPAETRILNSNKYWSATRPIAIIDYNFPCNSNSTDRLTLVIKNTDDSLITIQEINVRDGNLQSPVILQLEEKRSVNIFNISKNNCIPGTLYDFPVVIRYTKIGKSNEQAGTLNLVGKYSPYD